MGEIPTRSPSWWGTPIVKLTRLGTGPEVELFAKLEAFNPGGSVKDRIGVAMIEAAEREGRIEPGRSTIVRRPAATPGSRLRSCAQPRGTT